MLEKEIEAYLVKQVKAAKGRAYKFVSPGNAGVPDRMVLLPHGKIAFVELKTPGKKPTALQTNQMTKITKLGFEVFVIDSKSKVDDFLNHMKEDDQK